MKLYMIVTKRGYILGNIVANNSIEAKKLIVKEWSKITKLDDRDFEAIEYE